MNSRKPITMINPAKMNDPICVTCMLLLMSCDAIGAVHTFIRCDGTHLLPEIDKIFSLDVLLNNASAAHLIKDGVQNECNDGRQCVSNVSGAIAKDSVYLQGSLDLICDTDQVVCELNGFDANITDYKKVQFSPAMEYDVGITDKRVTKQTLHPSGVVVLSCSVTDGSNNTQLYWRSSSPGLYNIPAHYTYSNCHVQTTIHSIHDPKKHGEEMFFQCFYGDVEVGSIEVGITDEEGLPVHLFLTSLLVYLHFVIMPVVCSGTFLGRTDLVKRYRDPEKENMRRVRCYVSLSVAGAFCVWWIVVLSIHGWEYHCYFCFFLIETFFLVLYGAVRLVSTRLEEPEDRNLYNGRVALSCGAVIIPTVSWLMIKVQQDIPTSQFEGVWWFVTVFSLLAFVSVSQDREMKAWEKRS